MRLGIDFGTTRTVVAAAVKRRYPVLVFRTAHGFSDFVPGIAVKHPQGMKFGWEALREVERGQELELVIRSVKREVAALPPDEQIPDSGLDLTPSELLTEYLVALRRMIFEKSNLKLAVDEPLEAMIAVPAHAGTSQRYLTIEAFKKAGFRVLGLINEPTAAAIEYAYNNRAALLRRSPKRYVVIYDLGGGTFDTSAVSLINRRFELIASEGIARLGGEDFDQIILGLALGKAGVSEASLSPVHRARLLECCRAAKEALPATGRRFLVDFGEIIPGASPIILDVGEVTRASADLVGRTVALLGRILRDVREHGIDPDNARELGGVYLVGGSTAFPPVARALRELYGRKLLVAPQPHAATAVGLAVAADPESYVLVRESATRHFGVWREEEGGRRKIFDHIISKGVMSNDAGISIERRYRPVHAVGHLRFLECSVVGAEGCPEGEVTPWGDILFPYDPALAEQHDLSLLPPCQRLSTPSEDIVERYSYDRDGTISISIENTTHGYSRSYVLGEPAGLAAE